jgi:tetratricopeptide (TPR) repeat protein
MAAKVFLSYRREDSAGYTGRLQDRLAQEFGRDLLFMDMDTVPLGLDFVTVLRNEVAKCEVLLAVIGPHWLDARDDTGNRRLDNPHDFVRIEIGAALQRNIPVIPILLDGAKVPKANQLPQDLEELSLRNGLDVRHASFHIDIDKLVRSLKKQLGETDIRERRSEWAAKKAQRETRPEHAGAFNNRGIILHWVKRFDEALASYDRALVVRPGDAKVLYNRGNTLKELKRFDEALASYDRALAVRPEYAEALNNRGNTLKELKRFDEALASYDRALAVRPEYAEALRNRGNTLEELKRFDEALASYDRALAVRPEYAEAHLNESLVRLLTGDFVRGWKKFEWRWKSESLSLSRRNFAQPLWLGEDGIEGKTILLHSEQGLGDTIQFCRYAPLVAARGARVLLQVPASMQDLMASLAGVGQIIGPTSKLPDFDLHCPLLSLPLAFETRLDTIPSATPYLSASSERVSNWNISLGLKYRPRIGLVWSGSPAHSNDHNRSIELRTLLQLLDIDATFVSLQNDIRPDDATVLKDRSNFLHFGDKLKDFSDTAALISNLDLVISVDTSVAHLAGALAKPVWILLPFLPDWRWLLDRDDSPWYPTARLFRQYAPGDWSGVIDHVGVELTTRLCAVGESASTH